MPVAVSEDGPGRLGCTGLPDTVNVITVGQEFVNDGQRVDPVFAKDGKCLMTRIVEWAVHNTRVVIAMMAVVIIAGVFAFIEESRRKRSRTYRSRC